MARLAQERAHTFINELEDFAEEHDLTIDDLTDSNSYEWARHFDESYPNEHCAIFHYRNIEGEAIHVDVYEYRFESATLYFEKAIDD
ncbi:hypothetical protein SCOR_27395 [Sulfidibacter corallicola]|uniref:Uncharacterized protein n=1 Tax=Sulfidibacter corallicola TaxID=2818388 RepID=A0A8A4TP94_SULCO|nr:hypothetical protein [Sulfidibacter corallicola]QTD50721.1 hypothetical protein J3U87_34475 [Sulfidibacter corallicola]